MARSPGKLYGIITPDSDHVSNSSGLMEELADSLESQINDWQITLIHRKYRHKKIMKDKEDNDI